MGEGTLTQQAGDVLKICRYILDPRAADQEPEVHQVELAVVFCWKGLQEVVHNEIKVGPSLTFISSSAYVQWELRV